MNLTTQILQVFDPAMCCSTGICGPSLSDPSSLQGSHEEKLARTREMRDAIKAKIQAWCEEVCRVVDASRTAGL